MAVTSEEHGMNLKILDSAQARGPRESERDGERARWGDGRTAKKKKKKKHFLQPPPLYLRVGSEFQFVRWVGLQQQSVKEQANKQTQ